MKIPPKIIALIDRLYQELDQTEQNSTQGLTVVKQILENFPDNVILIQFFAYLNSVLLFTEIYRRQAQNLVQRVSNVDITEIEIQEVGEDLGVILGTVLEAKISVERIINRLAELR